MDDGSRDLEILCMEDYHPPPGICKVKVPFLSTEINTQHIKNGRFGVSSRDVSIVLDASLATAVSTRVVENQLGNSGQGATGV